MDVLACLADGLEECGEELAAVGQQLNMVVLEGQGEVLVDVEVDEGLVLFGQVQVLLLDEAEHGALRQLVKGALADHSLLAGVDAEEQVEHCSDDGHEQDDQRPCHGLGWLSVVHHHMDDGHEDENPVEY